MLIWVSKSDALNVERKLLKLLKNELSTKLYDCIVKFVWCQNVMIYGPLFFMDKINHVMRKLR